MDLTNKLLKVYTCENDQLLGSLKGIVNSLLFIMFQTYYNEELHCPFERLLQSFERTRKFNYPLEIPLQPCILINLLYIRGYIFAPYPHATKHSNSNSI